VTALAIVLIVIAAIVLVLFVLGSVAVTRRTRERDPEFQAKLAEANEALADAHAQDQGWDLPALEAAALRIVQQRNPGANLRGIHLIQVIDHPGTDDDQARFHVDVAMGRDFEILLGRRGGEWVELEQTP
jgi:hypothetical protein